MEEIYLLTKNVPVTLGGSVCVPNALVVIINDTVYYIKLLLLDAPRTASTCSIPPSYFLPFDSWLLMIVSAAACRTEVLYGRGSSKNALISYNMEFSPPFIPRSGSALAAAASGARAPIHMHRRHAPTNLIVVPCYYNGGGPLF